MNKQLIASICILGLVGVAVGVAVQGADTDTVTARVTPQIIAVSVDVENVDYGVLNVNDISDPSAVITATNDGNVAEKFEIMSSDSTDWTISNTAVGADIFMHEFATDDDTYTNYTAMDDTAYNTLDASVAKEGTQLFKLKLKMPSSTAVTTEQSTTVTVLATEAL